VILRTAGDQGLAVADTVNGGIAGSVTVTVNPAAAAHFLLESSVRIIGLGQAFSITVTALDPYNNLATGYLGTIHFFSFLAATLPADYTFTAADQGLHTFSGLTLNSPGLRYVRAVDTGNSSITGEVGLWVLKQSQGPTGSGPGSTEESAAWSRWSVVGSTDPAPGVWMATLTSSPSLGAFQGSTGSANDLVAAAEGRGQVSLSATLLDEFLASGRPFNGRFFNPGR
jgi:hypothetical protein